MNCIKLVTILIFSLVLMACGSGTATSASAPAASTLAMSFTPTKAFLFSWTAVSGATSYKLKEAVTTGSGYTLVKETALLTFDHVVPIYARLNAKYIIESCNVGGCTASTAVFTSTRVSAMSSSIGYVKASNTDLNDFFGKGLGLSSDGNTLAVSARGEDSSATGIGGTQNNNTAADSGAVYVFTRSGTTWTQQAYVKASNTDTNDLFGESLTLSSDGNTLAVGATGEDSNATGIGGNQHNTSSASGAVYVFSRSGTTWTQQAYVKASTTNTDNGFGESLTLSSDGNTLAVGASGEDSNATGIGGNQTTYLAGSSGAVYVFTRSGTTWTQQAYVKASNTGQSDLFGESLTLSSDGNTLSVGANGEDSNATGIGGNQSDNTSSASGAVYLY